MRRTFHDGNVTRYPESHFLDIVVDGRALSDSLPGSRGLVTPLNRAWLPGVERAIDELLGVRPADGLDIGRIFLFVCGACGDLACGAVTARLQVGTELTTWSQFAWENGYEPPEPIENAPASLAFETAQYEDALAGAIGRLRLLPYDELAHHGRRFLWPWQWGWRLPKNGD
ncbi:hypothetical protein ACFQDO_07405 [Angustibacter luteus]|uniref:Uncharacterized protein n=1 Tax=Angustibacter luteus TaxID=658456 RepID=A0ABW1JDP6_9ACTN